MSGNVAKFASNLVGRIGEGGIGGRLSRENSGGEQFDRRSGGDCGREFFFSQIQEKKPRGCSTSGRGLFFCRDWWPLWFWQVPFWEGMQLRQWSPVLWRLQEVQFLVVHEQHLFDDGWGGEVSLDCPSM